MSALTDYFTSLANKIRSKTGSSATLTPTQMVSEVDNVYKKAKDTAPKIISTKCRPRVFSNVWSSKTWSGSAHFNVSDPATYIWTDGIDIYYSYGYYPSGGGGRVYDEYVLDRSTSTWLPKTWNGFSEIWGDAIWTDGDNVYYSDRTNGQYVLDKSTSTWLPKTWGGDAISILHGMYIWTDGDNIYCSSSGSQYVLNKSNSTWTTKTWDGSIHYPTANNIWTDGDNIYYSSGTYHYALNKSNSTWTTKTWSGLTDFYATNIWTDGNNIYCSNGTSHYVLNKSNSTWTTKTWSGLTDFSGWRIWTDGNNIYYMSGPTNHYVLNTKSVVKV